MEYKISCSNELYLNLDASDPHNDDTPSAESAIQSFNFSDKSILGLANHCTEK